MNPAMIPFDKQAMAAANAVIALRRTNPGSCSLRLFCFPPAASGASVFRNWPQALPPHVEVCGIQLPGRESRIREEPPVSIREASEQLAPAIARVSDRPFAFYGHSMGALIAFEVARAVRKRHGIAPVHFFASAARSPQSRCLTPVLHAAPDEEFRAIVKRYGILATDALECAELIGLLEPLLRADMRLCEEYQYEYQAPFVCPFTVIGSIDDAWVRPRDLASWKEHTAGPFRVLSIEGGHQLDENTAASILSIIRNRLTPAPAMLVKQRQ